MAVRRNCFFALLSIVAPAAYASNDATTEDRNYAENYYVYTDLRDPLEPLLIVNDPDRKYVTRSDLLLSATISDNPSQKGPIILAFDWPHNVVFYLPEDFGPKMGEWTYQSCEYSIIGHRWGFRPTANREVHEYRIEQKCDDDANIVQYEYADFYGLQSIVVGNRVQTNATDSRFTIEDAYSLHAASFGFGARN